MSVTEFDFDPFSLDPFGGLWILLMSIVLLVIAAALSRSRSLGLEADMAISSVRGGVQILAMGFLLFFIFQLEDLLLASVMLAFIAVMVVVATYTSAKRAKDLPDPARATFWGMLAATVVTLGTMVGLQILPTRPEFLIPIAGMVVGNSMNTTSLALNRLLSEVRGHRTRIEARMLLGADAQSALQPHVRSSVRSSLIPTMDSIKTLGIVFIPGGMTGMLMGGVDPIWAAQYQLVIYFMIFCSSSIATTVATAIASKQLTAEGTALVDLPDPED
ncbi:MAG: iron export ABC transporter permease subunit FetB [Thermoplasmata archaeon]|nr:MAG: iron export ABC transporter permease subunit FetB [Thermoplasmata archaeon]